MATDLYFDLALLLLRDDVTVLSCLARKFLFMALPVVRLLVAICMAASRFFGLVYFSSGKKCDALCSD